MDPELYRKTLTPRFRGRPQMDLNPGERVQLGEVRGGRLLSAAVVRLARANKYVPTQNYCIKAPVNAVEPIAEDIKQEPMKTEYDDVPIMEVNRDDNVQCVQPQGEEKPPVKEEPMDEEECPISTISIIPHPSISDSAEDEAGDINLDGPSKKPLACGYIFNPDSGLSQFNEAVSVCRALQQIAQFNSKPKKVSAITRKNYRPLDPPSKSSSTRYYEENPDATTLDYQDPHNEGKPSQIGSQSKPSFEISACTFISPIAKTVPYHRKRAKTFMFSAQNSNFNHQIDPSRPNYSSITNIAHIQPAKRELPKLQYATLRPPSVSSISTSSQDQSTSSEGPSTSQAASSTSQTNISLVKSAKKEPYKVQLKFATLLPPSMSSPSTSSQNPATISQEKSASSEDPSTSQDPSLRQFFPTWSSPKFATSKKSKSVASSCPETECPNCSQVFKNSSMRSQHERVCWLLPPDIRKRRRERLEENKRQERTVKSEESLEDPKNEGDIQHPISLSQIESGIRMSAVSFTPKKSKSGTYRSAETECPNCSKVFANSHKRMQHERSCVLLRPDIRRIRRERLEENAIEQTTVKNGEELEIQKNVGDISHDVSLSRIGSAFPISSTSKKSKSMEYRCPETCPNCSQVFGNSHMRIQHERVCALLPPDIKKRRIERLEEDVKNEEDLEIQKKKDSVKYVLVPRIKRMKMEATLHNNRTCPYCKEEFHLWSQLDKHLKTGHHLHKIFKCSKCLTPFKTLASALHHMMRNNVTCWDAKILTNHAVVWKEKQRMRTSEMPTFPLFSPPEEAIKEDSESSLN